MLVHHFEDRLTHHLIVKARRLDEILPLGRLAAPYRVLRLVEVPMVVVESVYPIDLSEEVELADPSDSLVVLAGLVVERDHHLVVEMVLKKEGRWPPDVLVVVRSVRLQPHLARREVLALERVSLIERDDEELQPLHRLVLLALLEPFEEHSSKEPLPFSLPLLFSQELSRPS